MSNSGQVVVVTGAARGMGRVIATRFHEAGAKLALLDLRTEEMDEWTRGMNPDDVLTIGCDITRKQEVDAARDRVLEKFGRVDVLVNNAGIWLPGTPFEEVTVEAWNKILDVNLTGAFFCAQAFGTPMLDKGGAIVNIASIAGILPARLGSYSASKAGLIILTQQLAMEWGPRKVRVNAVCPGLVETPMSAELYINPEHRRMREQAVPLKRIGTPEDIAKAVCFLASPEADYINGEFVRVDGGFTLTVYGNVNS